jgi:pimeloyl-ACP methyl ester carboxylesterase
MTSTILPGVPPDRYRRRVTNTLVLVDGRTVEFRVTGPAEGLPVVFHHGTPGTLPIRGFERAVHDRGLRLLSISRPGYGDSTRASGRSVVDVVDDTAAVLQSIGAERFLLIGWSGGGPHALACAARLAGALGAAVLAGLAPSDGDGLEFTSGMNHENCGEWRAVFGGEADLRAHIEPLVPPLLGASLDGGGGDAAEADEELPPADVAALTGDFADDLDAANRDALRHGIDGWVDDELAFAKPWGFDLAEIDIPVSLWHGDDDVNVPFAHGRWLASHVPDASFHREEREGHLSIMAGSFDPMLDELITT